MTAERIKPITIRKATEGDYERIKNLLIREKLTNKAFFTKEKFLRTIDAHGKYNLVGEIDGYVAGTISGFDDGGIFYGYISRLAVSPSYRHRGIAKILIYASLEEFKNSGVGVVFAGVSHTNLGARQLLRGLSFVDKNHDLLYKEL